MNTSHPLNTTFIQKIERMAMGGVLLAISNQLTSTQITKSGTDLDLDTNCVNVQSMWPRLKSPLAQMLEFVFLHKTLFSEIPTCSNDSPLSDGGR
jgi:hypothetical protein